VDGGPRFCPLWSEGSVSTQIIEPGVILFLFLLAQTHKKGNPQAWPVLGISLIGRTILRLVITSDNHYMLSDGPYPQVVKNLSYFSLKLSCKSYPIAVLDPAANLFDMNKELLKGNLSDDEVFEHIQTLLDKNYLEYAYADLIAGEIGINQKKLNEIVRQRLGITACQLVEKKIVTKSIELLKQSRLTIKEIAWQLGYEDQYYFSRMFKKQIGLPPGRYRNLLKAMAK